MSSVDARERVKKPEPERVQPIRSWGVVFGTPPSQGTAQPGTPVSHGVEMGYRVIEEYLRQGQNVARAMGFSFPGGPGGTPFDDGLQNHMGAMLRSFSDFASLWMDLMGRMGARGGFAGPGAGVAPAAGRADPFAVGGPGEAGAPGRRSPRVPGPMAPSVAPEARVAAPLGLSLDIESSRRVELSVELHPRTSGMSLVVHDLRAPEPDKPRLTGVKLELLPDEERLVLRLRVPEGHPSGIYSGLILDERTSLPRGTLCVRIPSP